MTSTETRSNGEERRRHRAALDSVLTDMTSPQGAANELLGERQLWWKCCSEAVRTDPAWLSSDRSEEVAAWLDSTMSDQPADSMTPARHAYLLARALAAPDDQATEHDEVLTQLRSAWARSGLLSAGAAPGPALPSGRGVRDLPADVAGRMNAVIERILQLPTNGEESGRSGGPDGVLMIAALLMAGVLPRNRPLVRVPVVFGGSAKHDDEEAAVPGATGVLELREFPAGPPGLYPDPRSMTGLRSTGEQFATSLGRAWALAGPNRGFRCVLWRLVLTDPPVPPPQIEGPSLGAAFALGLRDLLRHPQTRRPNLAWLRGIFYGLRPRTAVTAALSNGEHLVAVSGMQSKLLAARRKGLRLVAPTANQQDVAHAPEPADVKFAETLRQADRYARRFRTGRLVTALALVVPAVTSGVVVQYRAAEDRQRLETAHQLAEVSANLLQSDVGLAQLFAEQAYRHNPDALTRRALFRAVTASPHLAGGVRASGTVTAVANTDSGGDAVVGTQNGEVEQWAVLEARFEDHKKLGRLAGPVQMVAADYDGETVAAIDDSTVRVWVNGRDAPGPRIPAGQEPTAVTVSDFGRFVAVTTTTSEFDVPCTLWVLDRDSGETRHVALKDITSDPTAVAVSFEEEVVVLEDAYGTWSRYSMPGLARIEGSNIGFGVDNFASALSPDGEYISYSNKAATLPIWMTRGTSDIDEPDMQAKTAPGLPSAMAISAEGNRIATSIGTTLHVTEVNQYGGEAPKPIALSGAGTVNEGALAFVGDYELISASGDTLSLWDLSQRSRIGKGFTSSIPTSCNACSAPRVSVSPDGRDVAVIDGNGTSLILDQIDRPGQYEQATQPLQVPDFAELLWWPDSSRIAVVGSDGSAQIMVRGRNGYRPGGTWPAVPNPLQLSDPPALLRFLPDGRDVAELHDSGTVRFRNAKSGKVLREVPGPRPLAPTVHSTSSPDRSYVALDARAAHAAVFESGLGGDNVPRVYVIETATGRIRTINTREVVSVAYAGEHLLLQRQSGDLESWTASGSQRLGAVEGTADTGFGPVVGGDVVAETTSENHTVRLLDLSSGAVIGTLPLPEGTKALSTGMTFTADGTKLVTATEAAYENGSYGETGHIIEWQLDPNDWVRIACSSTGRQLTPDEWEQHVGSEIPENLRCGG